MKEREYCWREGGRGCLSVQVTSEQNPEAKEGGSWRVTWDTDRPAEEHHAESREAGVCLAHAGRSGVRMGG